MKVEIKRNEAVSKKVKFPLIAENQFVRKGLVVLFLSENTGITLKTDNIEWDKVGSDCSNWFSCFDNTHWRILQEGESIELSNEFE